MHIFNKKKLEVFSTIDQCIAKVKGLNIAQKILFELNFDISR